MTRPATERFTDRVADYVKYRPGYPVQLMAFLHEACGVAPGARVADIGAGTGISSKMLLDAGHLVVAVEPNAAMREAAEAWLGDHPGFTSVAGTAEATTLANSSVALVTAAQAFHWFEPVTAKREFARILTPGGCVALFWNSRRLSGAPFLEHYEALLQRYGVDYVEVAERYADDAHMNQWFGHGRMRHAMFDNVQRLDFDGLLGRLMSSSYAPKAGHPNHQPMLTALRELFDQDACDGVVEFVYDTRVYVGPAVG